MNATRNSFLINGLGSFEQRTDVIWTPQTYIAVEGLFKSECSSLKINEILKPCINLNLYIFLSPIDQNQDKTKAQ